MTYRVECTNCHKVEHHEHLVDFSSTRCNDCNSLAFGIKKYRVITAEEAKYVRPIPNRR